jgi:hypothetical protein
MSQNYENFQKKLKTTKKIRNQIYNNALIKIKMKRDFFNTTKSK